MPTLDTPDPSTRRRRVPGAALALALVVGAAVTVPAGTAAADYNTVAYSSVYAQFCWTRYDGGFGSGYYVKAKFSNGSPAAHTAQLVVNGATTTVPLAPWATSGLSTVVVSIERGDTFTYLLDGVARTYGALPAVHVRAYMTNCETDLGSSPARNQAMAYAASRMGDYYVGGGSPYRKGSAHGNTTATTGTNQSTYYSHANTIGYDCSGLTFSAYQSAGIWIPDYTGGLRSWAGHAPQPLSTRVPGDLLVKSGHVGIYVGRGADATTEYVIEATPWNKVSGAGTPGSPYTAFGVRVTPYSTFVGSGSYQVVKPF